MTKWRTLNKRRRAAANPRVMLRRHLGRMERAALASGRGATKLAEAMRALARALVCAAARQILVKE